MLHFGEQLKMLREVRGYSLEYIEDAVNIPRFYLKAIEAGEFDTLPQNNEGPAMIRRYAAILGINPDEAVDEFYLSTYTYRPSSQSRRPSGGFQNSSAPHRLAAYKTDAEAPQPNNRKLDDIRIAGFPLFNVALALIFLMGALWLGNTFLIPSLNAGIGVSSGQDEQLAYLHNGTAREEALKKQQPSRGDEPDRTNSEAVQAANGSTGRSENLSTANGGQSITRTMLLEISASEESWVKIVADGQIQYEGIMGKGESMKIEAETLIKLKTSNAAALVISFNGESLKPIGEANEVVEKDFSW